MRLLLQRVLDGQRGAAPVLVQGIWARPLVQASVRFRARRWPDAHTWRTPDSRPRLVAPRLVARRQDVCLSIWTPDHAHDLMWKVTDVCDPKDCPSPLDVKVEPYKGRYLWKGGRGSRPAGPAYAYIVKCWCAGARPHRAPANGAGQPGTRLHACRQCSGSTHAPPDPCTVASWLRPPPQGRRHAAARSCVNAAGPAAEEFAPLDDRLVHGAVAQKPGAALSVPSPCPVRAAARPRDAV